MLFRKEEKSPDVFWREYEEKIGEKILAYSLGKYLSGWEEFDSQGWTGIWGLIIASSGGFRFHHLPQRHWLDFFSHFNGSESSREKAFFIAKDLIISAGLHKESRWWKKITAPAAPKLVIQFRDDSGNERLLLLEADFKIEKLIESLNIHSKLSTD